MPWDAAVAGAVVRARRLDASTSRRGSIRIMGDDGDDFTFAAAQAQPLAGGGVGVMGAPLYPVFGRPRSPPRPAPEPETATARVPLGRLLLVDRDPPSPRADCGSDGDDLDSVPPELYCPWSPGWSAAASPARCKKSGSTGSVLRWRPRLVGVGRSQSDGKEKFVFLNATTGKSRSRKGRGAVDGAAAVAGGGAGAHAWSYYAKGGDRGGDGARRRSFLPYKQDLVGLFANAAVFRRSYHPF